MVFGHKVSELSSGRAKRLVRWTVDAILPPRCPLCQTGLARSDALCAACWRQITFLVPPVCDRFGVSLPFDAGPGGISAFAATNPPPYARARAVARFDGAMRDLIHKLKYGDREDVAVLLAGLFRTPLTMPLVEAADVLVPVPLAWRRLVWRRFNQAAHLAVHLGRLAEKPVAFDILKRRRWTPSQVGLTHRQRQDNVAGVFVVPKAKRSALEGKRVLLIDDVITTGATIDAAAKALLRSGALAVDVVALAMVDAPRRLD
jgi:ComF family protein